MRTHLKPIRSLWIILSGIGLAALAFSAIFQVVSATPTDKKTDQPAPIHPVFAFLDENGENVLSSGLPVSTLRTCGDCHDTDYIVSHNFHSDLGLSDLQAGNTAFSQPWDTSNGPFGKWDPLTYRYLSQPGDELLDLGTPEWLMQFGSRVVGSGPAATSRTGEELTSLKPAKSNPETSILDAETGKPVAWNWKSSGSVELDCFLCHLPGPDAIARSETLRNGDFGWANTATLLKSGLVSRDASGEFTWERTGFDENGKLLPKNVTIQSPTNENCGICHDVAHTGNDALLVTDCSLENSQTALTGQVVSGQKISESGVNLAGKADLTMAWDVHAERQLNCVDCHYSLNNPVAYQENSTTRPAGLLFDPRHLDFGDFMKYPDHNIARGQSAQYNVAPELKGSMRRCESCHDAQAIHSDWLPYSGRHMSSLACETCHIPQLFAPAIQAYDWTVIKKDASPASTCRGVEGDGGSISDLVSGFQPIWMERSGVDGEALVSPYNLITTWYWTYQDAQGNVRPVRQIDLQAVFLDGEGYTPEVMAIFDYDGNGELYSTELRIDSDEKENLIAGRLMGLGLNEVKIAGTIQPYSINHGVMTGDQVISDCRSCHSDNSRLSRSMQLAAYIPGGVLPVFASGTNVSSSGNLETSGTALVYQPDPSADGLYLFGHSRIAWVDWVGGLFFLFVLLGVCSHGILRMVKAARLKRDLPQLTRMDLYQPYERFWHWLQTALIVILLLTGLIIHRPDFLGGLSFRGLVIIHNVSAATLAINALLSLFYHLTTGQIQHFIPRPYGFFDDAIVQTRYYLRGIFQHAPHPFEKNPLRKMNPLQQLTYLGILNVLLPLQGLTGIFMWGAQRWPAFAKALGGLPTLTTFHTLLAWLFAAFILGHVYLTTTSGLHAFDSIKAMVTGWEDVEAHEPEEKND